MMIRRVLFVIVLAVTPIADATACADPPKASFREIVASAPTIFTFQLTSAFKIHKPLGDTVYTEYAIGHIKVIDSLKGDADTFKMVKYSFRSCGSTRMSVGQTYLAATSQTGPLLELWGMDQAILDLSLDFYHETTKQSSAVDIVKGIISGAAVPADFPRGALLTPLDVYPVPEPPGH
jgi:hypothetical protein